MNCEICRELFWAYLEHELTAEEKKKMEQHFVECAACREEAEMQKELLDSLKSLPEAELPERYHEELMQKLKAEATSNVVPFPVKKKQPRWKQFSLVAAAALIVVAAGGMDGILDMRQDTMKLQSEANISMTEEEFSVEEVTITAADTEESVVDTQAVLPAESNAKLTKPKQKELLIANDTADAFPVYDTAEEMTNGSVAGVPEMASVTEGEAVNPFARTIEVAEEMEHIIMLQTADVNTARESIHEWILDVGGYEEAGSAEWYIYAKIPVENAEKFFEGLKSFGEMQWIQQGCAMDGNAYNSVQIQLKTEE